MSVIQVMVKVKNGDGRERRESGISPKPRSAAPALEPSLTSVIPPRSSCPDIFNMSPVSAIDLPRIYFCRYMQLFVCCQAFNMPGPVVLHEIGSVASTPRAPGLHERA